jgi:hypothetical protein
MTVTRADYDRALSGFVTRMSSLGKDLQSIVLYGSLARSDLRPGKSDLLDAYIFFSQRALERLDGYRRVVTQLVDACKALAESGLPYQHPAHYYGDEETAYLPAEFLPELMSDEYSTVLWGSDVRASFRTDDAIAAARFEEFRQYAILPMAGYLVPVELSPEERVSLAKQLDLWFRKLLPASACAATGEPVPGPAAVGTLRELFPDVDLTVLDAIKDLREASKGPPGADDLRALLRKGLVLTEELYRRIQEVSDGGLR